MSQSTELNSFFGRFKSKSANVVHTIEHLSYLPSARTTLLVSLSLLICISLLMIASASVPFAVKNGMSELSFFYRQLGYIIMGVGFGWLVYKAKLKTLCNISFIMFSWLVCVVLLIITLLVAPEINGAKRWLNLGFGNFQPAELCKMVMAMVVAEYAVRRSAEVRESATSSLRLIVPFLPIGFLLMLQPDYGTSLVVIATTLVILFIAGAPIRQYILVLSSSVVVLSIPVVTSDYRMRRLTGFLDPFGTYQGDGYQLANSLMALGRGGITGLGYGDSVQKLSHLPEAHTDFLLAITGEELGLIGVLVVLTLEFLIIGSIMAISYATLKRRQLILSYTTFAFAIIFFGQVVINAAMNFATAPTKGLTMPFFSYGGSSILISCLMIGYVLNVYKNSPIIAADRESARY
ncbi:FtsW/RodA/SpoVE family cell cycle protein [Moraxella pluranimalium]|uniref:FtsW/RodA/SpoVE family cell cycle protein n=1 Tax=Moraxella pluranimalium TaxID=470453 RepID=UPI0009941BD5|nr:putative peptidoglycan glycosyltransferase FtsW [Moraxella pluranimalium]